MAVVVDVRVLERDFQQLIQRTRRPFRLGEGALILRKLDLVTVDLLGSSRQRLNPMRLRQVAGLERIGVPGIVEILVARCPLMIQDRNRRADFRKVDRAIRLAGREGREILLPWQLKPCLRVKLRR